MTLDGTIDGLLDRPVPAPLVLADDGRRVVPADDAAWDGWVSAGRTRNHLLDDPILDWLGRYGEAAGYERDDELEGFDPRTDFLGFIFERGQLFEEGVIRLIAATHPIVRISHEIGDSRELDAAVRTVEAMRAGAPVITQAVLRNPENRTYGVVDLLVRSDVVNGIVPGTLLREEATAGAPRIGASRHHYLVVDVKFHTFDFYKGGELKVSDALPYMAQVWVYNEALGRIQGYLPPASYLLGRNWKENAERGGGCFDRLARVDHGAIVDKAEGTTLAERTGEALAWVRRLRAEGASWRVLPTPSIPELYPHMRNDRDAPWRRAKRRIGRELGELTLLPAMNPARRREAHAAGIVRWTDVRASAAALGVADKYATRCDGVLAANRAPAPVVLPRRIEGNAEDWRVEAPLELYVDFETVSNLADDFSRLPSPGGQALIFQIGAGHYEAGEWRFAQWTVDRLVEPDEARIIGEFVAHLDALRRARGLGWHDIRLVHWSSAETSTLETGYNSARRRQPREDWPELPWFDFLAIVARAAPVTITGAFDFGLKSIAKAMRELGLIETAWEDGPTDGLGAMVGAWWCDAEAARVGGSIRELEVMQGIERYNEVDCRAMSEVVRWLRENR